MACTMRDVVKKCLKPGQVFEVEKPKFQIFTKNGSVEPYKEDIYQVSMPSEKQKYVELCTKVHIMWDKVKTISSEDRFSFKITDTNIFLKLQEVFGKRPNRTF